MHCESHRFALSPQYRRAPTGKMFPSPICSNYRDLMNESPTPKRFLTCGGPPLGLCYLRQVVTGLRSFLCIGAELQAGCQFFARLVGLLEC